MKIGYACINTSMPSKFKTCRLSKIQNEGLPIIKELSYHNLNMTKEVLKWNAQHGISFYRLSSDLIPFATHEINNWIWWRDEKLMDICSEIKKIKSEYRMILSMHPGQYSPLNTPSEEILRRTIADFEYHQKLLNLVGGEHMITHVGGAYGDKEKSKKRFAERYDTLSSDIKTLLRLENDDKVYTVEDVLDIHHMCGVPICFDIHHHRCNPSAQPIESLIPIILQSWEHVSSTPKVHISSGKTSELDRSHHDYVFENDLEWLLELFEGHTEELNIMVEAKEKDKAALRLINSLVKVSSS
jgi:UV DNA damage endonuclease